MVWYSHLFQNFPLFVVIYTVKGFSLVNEAEVDIFLEFFSFSMIQTVKGFGIVIKAEIDVFLELSCFFHDPANVGNSLPFLKPA